MNHDKHSTGSKRSSARTGVVAKSNGITPAESLHEGLPELKFEWLPKKMADMAETLSKSQQVQPAMAIMACIATASACVVGKYRIADISKNWDEEWSSLYTILIAPSGGRKSSVFKKVIKPIELWHRERNAEIRPDYVKALGTLKLRQKELDNLQKKAETGDKVAKAELALGDPQKAVIDATKKLPVLPDLIVNDATAAALETRLASHHGRLFSADSEGGALKNLTGARWKTPPEFIAILKAFSGDYIRTDRISRSAEIHQPAMTILWMVQPSIIKELANHPAMRNEGLWNRFLFVLLPSIKHKIVPSRDAPEFNKEVAQEWQKILWRLLDTNHQKETDEGIPVPHDQSLSKGAEEVRHKYEVSIRDAIQDGERLEEVDQWGEKAPGIAIRIAAVLELFEQASNGVAGALMFKKQISKKSMERAVHLMKPMEDDYLRVMAPKASPEAKAQYVMGKLNEMGGEASRRDLRTKCRTIKSDPELEPYLALLEKSGSITRSDKTNPNGVVSEIIKKT